MKPSLVILAAGVGSRYGGLKQLDPVGPSGETILEYSIYDADRAGFGSAVLVVRPDTESEFRRAIGSRIGARVPIEYVHQRLEPPRIGSGPGGARQKPWGTGQAVLAAADAGAGPFAVINADDFYGTASYQSLAACLLQTAAGSPAEFCLLGFAIGPTLTEAGAVSRGLCRAGADGWLQRIDEVFEVRKHGDGGRYRDGAGVERQLDGSEPVSMNMWGFTPAVFGELRRQFADFLERSGDDAGAEFLLPAAVQSLIDSGRARVRVLPEADRWCGVTYREDRDAVVAHITVLAGQGDYPARLWD